MESLFYNMRHRKTIRLRKYDYTKEGWYFVTIEPNDRKYSFCKILNGNIILNKIGKIIDERWRWLFSRYDHIMMDEYIIMPVHFGYNHQNRLDLSHIIGAFKTTASKRIHEAGYPNFKWKRSFHDRIIRQDELEIKRAYIR